MPTFTLKRLFLLFILIYLCMLAVACDKSSNKTYELTEKKIVSDDYLITAGIDDSGNVIAADSNSYMIFNESLNLIRDIPHENITPFICYVSGDSLYSWSSSGGLIYKYLLINNRLGQYDTINIGLQNNASIIRIREQDNGIYCLVFLGDAYEFVLYRYDFKSGTKEQIDIKGINCFDTMGSNELMISAVENNTTRFSVYDTRKGKVVKEWALNDSIFDFTYGGDQKILCPQQNKMVSISLADGKQTVIYSGSENALLSGYIHKSKDYYYFSDNTNSLLIKLPVIGTYSSSYVPEAAPADIDAPLPGRDGDNQIPDIVIPPDIKVYMPNQEAIDKGLSEIKPVSDESFELVILTDKYSQSEHIAETMFKNKYPNANIKYEVISDSILQTEDPNPYESEYDKQLKLKLMANEKDFDLFYIESPETLTQIVHSGGYLDLSQSNLILNCMDKMFDGVVQSSSHNGAIFGVPVYARYYGMEVNEALVQKYSIAYPFKTRPLLISELPEFAERYCGDYDNDGVPDVYLTTSHEIIMPDGTRQIANSLGLEARYSDSYINHLDKTGFYDVSVLNEITRINELLEPYSLLTGNVFDSRSLFFGLSGTCGVDLLNNTAATFSPVFADKEVYIADYYYMCGNKFSDKKEYIYEFLACIADELNVDMYMRQIYKDPLVYEKYIRNYTNDAEHFAFYQRIVDHSIPRSMLSWEASTELNKANQDHYNRYLRGEITIDELYEKYNQKLDMIFNE